MMIGDIKIKKYILCELDDENYTEPTFFVYQSKEEAFENAIKTCIGVVENNDFKIEVENNQNRVSVNFSENSFFVTEIKEFDSNDGEYILVWHHAYDGVGFYVEYVGSYEECKLKMKQCAQKRQEEIEDDLECEVELEWEDGFQTCIDTGNEWEIWSIIKIDEKEQPC